jgi:ketosteroid isomerase-like protein
VETVKSEFAAVDLDVDGSGNGPRLRIEDLKTGRVGYLDALELETLAWLPEGALHPLLDPSALRWGDAPAEPAIAELVKRLYEALAVGEEDELKRLLADDFEADLPEGMPLGAGGRRRGPEDMIEHTWWVLGRVVRVRVEVDAWIPCAGGRLLVAGTYRGTSRSSGREFAARLAHLWSASDGRITHLWHLSDTAMWAAALAE